MQPDLYVNMHFPPGGGRGSNQSLIGAFCVRGQTELLCLPHLPHADMRACYFRLKLDRLISQANMSADVSSLQMCQYWRVHYETEREISVQKC